LVTILKHNLQWLLRVLPLCSVIKFRKTVKIIGVTHVILIGIVSQLQCHFKVNHKNSRNLPFKKLTAHKQSISLFKDRVSFYLPLRFRRFMIWRPILSSWNLVGFLHEQESYPANWKSSIKAMSSIMTRSGPKHNVASDI